MRRASIGIHIVVEVILIVTSAPLPRVCASLIPHDSSPHWVPFVAKIEQVNKAGSSSVRLRGEGVYVRDSRGVSYSRTVFSSSAVLVARGAVDVAFLDDRPNHTTYLIDFAKKTIKQRRAPSDNPGFALEPPSRADFERQHAADLFLGKQVVSGFECIGYKIADPHHKGKYLSEGWYAPSLNYLLVRFRGPLADGGETTVLFKDIKSGKEPDPSFFHLPEGFKWVK